MKTLKKILATATFAAIAQGALAQPLTNPINGQVTDAVLIPKSGLTEPTIVSSQITEATVFLRGAQVTRFAQPSLVKGENILVLRGLASGIDPNSIQVKAPQDILLNSVTHEVNYLQGLKQPKRIAILADSAQLLRDLNTQLSQEANALEQEKQLVLANQRLAGEQNGVDVAELEKAANFFRTRLRDIADKGTGLQKRIADNNKRLARINQQMQELNADLNRPSNDIVVKLGSPDARRIDLEVRYLVQEAQWTPGYDIRAKDAQGPIRLDYRADVIQLTGEDWVDVKLKLSTGNPSLGGTAPVIAQWNLYAYDPRPVYTRAKAYDMAPSAPQPEMAKSEAYSADEVAEEKEIDFDKPGTTLANYTQVQAGATTAEFVISVAQTVKSGEKPQQVSVQSSELPAEYRHYAVPKLDLDAFLTARITGWEKLNLLQGNARIFFDGTYVTEAFLDPALTDDTLSLSLGRDPKVIITRDMLKDFNKAKVIGFNREKTIAYEIKVRNTKSSAMRLSLEDQVPISQDKDIVVKVEEISGAKHNIETGLLSWDVNLAPGETKTFRVIFTVKHPKSKTVPGI